MKRLVFVVALLTMLVAAVPASAAGETIHYRFTGQFANANFTRADPMGCVVTDVGVFPTDGRIKVDGSSNEAASSASIYISQYDSCSETQLLAASGYTELAADAFTAAPKLSKATLNTTIEVYDYVSGTSFPVAVSVSWTGSGDTFRMKDHYQYKSPGFLVNGDYDSTYRTAKASGTIVGGTANFTLESTDYAGMGSAKSGSVTIVHE
jgi:hypothetical protein